MVVEEEEEEVGVVAEVEVVVKMTPKQRVDLFLVQQAELVAVAELVEVELETNQEGLQGCPTWTIAGSSSLKEDKKSGTVKWGLAKVISGHQDGIWEICCVS